jgi:hypothetical protein
MLFARETTPKFLERLKTRYYESPRKRRLPDHWPKKPTKLYYYRLRCKARAFKLPLKGDGEQWFDLWHTHFDWHGFGELGSVERRRHLRFAFTAFTRVCSQLRDRGQSYEAFVNIGLHSPASDAIYVHTPNPNGTEFPTSKAGSTQIFFVPPVLAHFVDFSKHRVFRSVVSKDVWYSVFIDTH